MEATTNSSTHRSHTPKEKEAEMSKQKFFSPKRMRKDPEKGEREGSTERQGDRKRNTALALSDSQRDACTLSC